MRRLAIGPVISLMLCLIAAPMSAAPVRVTSGEHEGFTRLVIESDIPQPWALGRTEEGYELRLSGLDAGFDLGAAFALIGRGRLAALSQDPARGALRIAMGCACHVAPFEMRPGTLVIDLKDGPPPAGSAFEQALPPLPVAVGSPTPHRAAPAVSLAENTLATAWLGWALGQEGAENPAPGPLPVPAHSPSPPDPGLAPLRDALVREISRGAANGVVGMELPETSAAPMVKDGPNMPLQGRAGLGALPQIRIDASPAAADLGAEGAVCPKDPQLDVAAWGSDAPVWEQISSARTGLTGEFDRPDDEAVARAIKFHLFIGFGQEALALLQGFGLSAEEARLWSSMAHILDDLPDPDPAFSGLDACDSAAALWAFLSGSAGATGSPDVLAIQRGFSALPATLRHLLGPRLVERLDLAGKRSAVEVIANAIRRVDSGESRDIALMQARMAAGSGDFQEADQLLRPLLADPGPQTPEALVAQIEGNAARGLPLPPATLAQIEAYASERASGPDSAAFHRAHRLALALTGDFAQAFTGPPDDAALKTDLWRLLAALGTDEAVLSVAAIAPGAAPPPEASAQAAGFAERFLALGLPDQALKWLSGAPQVHRLLAARIALARHDGLEALAQLRGMDDAAAAELRLAATLLTGDDAAAAAALLAEGRAPEASAALARAGDWDSLSLNGLSPWKGAAGFLAPPANAPQSGPLARGTALADHALATRDAVTSLLAAVPRVENLSP